MEEKPAQCVVTLGPSNALTYTLHLSVSSQCDKANIIWEEEPPTEKMPPSEWPIDKSVGAFPYLVIVV